MLEARPKWRELLMKYRFDTVLCPPDLPLASLLKTNPDWRIADQDADSVLFVKN